VLVVESVDDWSLWKEWERASCRCSGKALFWRCARCCPRARGAGRARCRGLLRRGGGRRRRRRGLEWLVVRFWSVDLRKFCSGGRSGSIGLFLLLAGGGSDGSVGSELGIRRCFEVELVVPFAAVYLMYRWGHRWRGTISASFSSTLSFACSVASCFCSSAAIVDVAEIVFWAMTVLMNYRWKYR
jgi:hypothetical protein